MGTRLCSRGDATQRRLALLHRACLRAHECIGQHLYVRRDRWVWRLDELHSYQRLSTANKGDKLVASVERDFVLSDDDAWSRLKTHPSTTPVIPFVGVKPYLRLAPTNVFGASVVRFIISNALTVIHGQFTLCRVMRCYPAIIQATTHQRSLKPAERCRLTGLKSYGLFRPIRCSQRLRDSMRHTTS